jgi:hypothetical protein
MSYKIINLPIPTNENIPDEISTFSPEENLKMIKIGCECLLEGRKAIAGLTQQEIYNKIKDESKEEVKKMELDILVERELSKKMEDNISKMYEGQISKLEKQMALLLKQLDTSNQQIKNYESENTIIIQKEVDKLKYNYDLLLQEKDKQNQLNREVFDKAEKLINKNLNKSSILLGDDGEQIFENLSDTFKDFAGYKIENKAKQGHKGDFHLFFKDFNILVDSKNYSGSVQKKEVIKIETDLTTNDNMKFAWMVSLNTNISDYNRFPIMTKWITTDVGAKCILFINNLLEHKDPRNILRQAWTICNEFNKLIKENDSDDDKLNYYIERDLILNQKFKQLQERSTEMRRNMNGTLKILKDIDNDIIELLSLVSNEIMLNVYEKNNVINEWWNNNIEYTEDDNNKLISTEIWNKFKKENKEYVLEKKISIEIFKEIIIKNISISKYTEKTKKGAIEFIGIKFKNIVIETNNLIIETENLIDESKKKKVKKEKQKSQYYFNEETDNKILEEYNDISSNIISISENNSIQTWQVISLLIHYKTINKRCQAKGYEQYTETEEYKQKFN